MPSCLKKPLPFNRTSKFRGFGFRFMRQLPSLKDLQINKYLATKNYEAGIPSLLNGCTSAPQGWAGLHSMLSNPLRGARAKVVPNACFTVISRSRSSVFQVLSTMVFWRNECRHRSKINKSACWFQKKLKFDWLVDNPSQHYPLNKIPQTWRCHFLLLEKPWEQLYKMVSAGHFNQRTSVLRHL